MAAIEAASARPIACAAVDRTSPAGPTAPSAHAVTRRRETMPDASPWRSQSAATRQHHEGSNDKETKSSRSRMTAPQRSAIGTPRMQKEVAASRANAGLDLLRSLY